MVDDFCSKNSTCPSLEKFGRGANRNKEIIAMWIEGTRSKKEFVYSGFYHIAVEINADILISFLNHDDNIYRCLLIKNEELNQETILEKFRIVIKDKNIAFYPKYLSKLQFRTVKNDSSRNNGKTH